MPLAPSRSHIPDDHVFDSLELHAFAPYPATFRLYEDDGLTRAYERGDFAQTTFKVSASEIGVVIDITPGPGTWRPACEKRQIAVVLHGSAAPTGVDGVEGVNWMYDEDTRCTTVHFTLRPGEPGQIRVIGAG